MSTRGIANECKVIQGLRGGQYFENSSHIDCTKKHQVAYYDQK